MIDKILAVHDGLEDGGIPHAFGGAIALAYCLVHPRATVDIDVNVFVTAERAERVLRALPEGVGWSDEDVAALRRDDQVRLWWGEHPLDLFFVASDFHGEVARRVRSVPFEGRTIPVLDCASLAVFKVLFDRGKDWVDLEAMSRSGTLDVRAVSGWVGELVGADDSRLERLRTIADLEPEDEMSAGPSFRDLLDDQ